MLLGHSRLALSLIVPFWAIIWFGAPWIQRTFLSSEYELSKSLILAALVAGTIKAFSGITQASVTALASVRSMERIGALGWASIVIGTLAAWYGARFGLPGVVFGVAIAWFLRLVSAAVIVSRELRDTNPVVHESM